MRILLIAFLVVLLGMPSYMARTVTATGWGHSMAYEAWVLFNAVIVIAMYFSTRNIFSIFGALLLTGCYTGLFCVYTGINLVTVSLAGLGLGLLAGVLAYIVATPVQLFLLKGEGRESYSVLFAILSATLTAMYFCG
ncbi:MAG: hypothetical protein IJD65_00200 [Mailhella sp.]|nr:hypothetical protein [Mailhella sp.]